MIEKRQPRLLIVSRNLALLRGHYEDVIVALVRAGVDVSVHAVNEKGLDQETFRRILAGRGCEVRVSPLSLGKEHPGDRLALRLRQLANLLRFYHHDYRRRGPLLETRLAKAAPGPRRWAVRLGRLGSRPASIAIRLGASVDRVLPPSATARGLIADEQPDAVAAADVIRSPGLVDFLKAAAWERIATASWVQSWDNLTTQGLIHLTPDRVFVWNTFQRDELRRYHRVPDRHVCVTGAQTFDHWFSGETPTERAEFCAQNGLDPERPIILYLASSRLAETSPADFFLPWLRRIHSSGDPALSNASVIVRPHPTDVQPWLELDRRYPQVALSPSAAGAPMSSPEFRRRFRDELHHASVAVGLNTSAMIDAAIFGKPVCTIELPELRKAQRGTIHFEYFMTVEGGFVRTASTLDEHLATLGELVSRDPNERDERSDRFVQAFVRPHGLDVTPAEVFSKEMLRLIESPSTLRLPSRLGRATGRFIRWAAPVLGAPLEEKPQRLRFRERQLARMRAMHQPRWRARLKPLRRFFRVRLRAAARARLRRLRKRNAAGSPQA